MKNSKPRRQLASNDRTPSAPSEQDPYEETGSESHNSDDARSQRSVSALSLGKGSRALTIRSNANICTLCGDVIEDGAPRYRTCKQHYECGNANKSKARLFDKDPKAT